MSDGRRFAVIEVGEGELRIIDTETGRSLRLPVAPGCPMAAMAEGELLLACQPARLVDLAGVQSHPVTGALPGDAAGRADEFYALGRSWLQGTGRAPDGSPADVFVNERTGERRVIQRHRNIADLGPGAGPPDVDDPALGDSPRCSHQWIYAHDGSQQVIAGLGGQLLLQRCGQSTRSGRVLDTCGQTECRDVQLNAGVVSWSQGATAYAFSLARARTRRWRFPGFRATPSAPAVEVAHTTKRILFAVPERAPAGSGTVTRFYGAGL